MELIVIVGVLAVIALLGNIRMLAVCALLAIGGAWYYDQLPDAQKDKVLKSYESFSARIQRAWDAFSKA